MAIRAITIFVASLFLLSCQDKGVKPTVGLLMDDFKHDRWKSDLRLLEDKLEDRDILVDLKIAEGNADLQTTQAKELVDKGVKALILVASDLDKASEIVQYASDKNVPVIAYDRLVKKCELDYYVSFDHINVGRQQAVSILDNVPVPEIAVIGGSVHDNNAFLISAGQNSVLQPLQESGALTIVANVFTEQWGEEEAYGIVKHLLGEYPGINAILVANDALATGAAVAIEEAGEKNIYITGMDADSSALNRIRTGKQNMTVYKPIDKLAESVADLTEKICINDTLALQKMLFVKVNNGLVDVKSILLPSEVVNESNIDIISEKQKI